MTPTASRVPAPLPPTARLVATATSSLAARTARPASAGLATTATRPGTSRRVAQVEALAPAGREVTA